MAGLFDLHAVAALQRGLPLYWQSLPEFQALFPQVEDAVTQAWHAALAADPPEVACYGQKTNKEFPVVIVTTPDEQPDSESPLNGFAYRDAQGHEHVQEVGNETLSIEVLTRDVDTTRAVMVVVRAAMAQALDWFLAAQYESISFGGVDPLTPEEDLAAEAMGIHVRRVRYTAKSTLDVKRLDPLQPDKPWFVGAADETFDGKPGHVVPFKP